MANGEVMELMRTRLREAREAQGLTQRELAEIIGAGKGVVMGLENTSLMRAVNLDALCDVCDALDISIDWLFGQTTNKQGFQPGEVQKVPSVVKFFNPRWNEEGVSPYVPQEMTRTKPMLGK